MQPDLPLRAPYPAASLQLPQSQAAQSVPQAAAGADRSARAEGFVQSYRLLGSGQPHDPRVAAGGSAKVPPGEPGQDDPLVEGAVLPLPGVQAPEAPRPDVAGRRGADPRLSPGVASATHLPTRPAAGAGGRVDTGTDLVDTARMPSPDMAPHMGGDGTPSPTAGPAARLTAAAFVDSPAGLRTGQTPAAGATAVPLAGASGPPADAAAPPPQAPVAEAPVPVTSAPKTGAGRSEPGKTPAIPPAAPQVAEGPLPHDVAPPAAQSRGPEVAQHGIPAAQQVRIRQFDTEPAGPDRKVADIALAETGVTGRGGEMRVLPAGAERAEQPTTAQLVRAMAAQLVDGFRGSSARHVEIRLEPRELGHVRMTLSLADQGGNVTLTADRPETLDLMRRHIGILSQEFADLGYGGVEFSFAGGGGQGAGDGRHAAGGGNGAAPAGAPAAEPQAVAAAGMQMALPLSDGALDIRV